MAYKDFLVTVDGKNVRFQANVAGDEYEYYLRRAIDERVGSRHIQWLPSAERDKLIYVDWNAVKSVEIPLDPDGNPLVFQEDEKTD